MRLSKLEFSDFRTIASITSPFSSMRTSRIAFVFTALITLSISDVIEGMRWLSTTGGVTPASSTVYTRGLSTALGPGGKGSTL